VDWIFVAFSGMILTGVVLLQKSLGDIVGDEAELSSTRNQLENPSQKKSFLKKRENK